MRELIAPLTLLAVVACGGTGDDAVTTSSGEEVGAAAALDVDEPEPLVAPDYQEPESETDWAARVNNKQIEIIGVLNVINPVAAHIQAGFERYGDRFSSTLQEEWEDTQAQLTQAMTLYEECKARMEAGEFDKQLFLDMEEVWQLLVKTGVAGVRTKSMVDAEIARLTG